MRLEPSNEFQLSSVNTRISASRLCHSCSCRDGSRSRVSEKCFPPPVSLMNSRMIARQLISDIKGRSFLELFKIIPHISTCTYSFREV